jgi:signal transduction histidine kinase
VDDGIPFDEKRGGLGLAVPLARRVIEKHGGRVVSSENQGRSIAIVTLPLS